VSALTVQRRTLGKTGLEVSELALGGLFVSEIGGPFEQAREAIHRALELGVNYIDTAPACRNSETVIGRALEDVDRPLILSTKLAGKPEPFDPRSRDCLLRSLESSMRALGRDHIETLVIHEPDRPRQYDWWAGSARCEGPVMDVLEELRSEGTVDFLGLGGTTAYEIVPLIRTGRFDLVLTAFNYSPLWREAEREVLPAAAAQGMGIVVGSALQQGALARRYEEEIAGGAPWLSPPRREQYGVLYAFLDEIAAMVPFRPFCEPFSLPFGRDYRGPGPAAG
jgi:aryl-alcohol dehydrogenase-like predicted oxidoreductase